MTLRVALVDHARGELSRELAETLRAAGHCARVVGGASLPGEAVLRRRGFAESLTTVPFTTAALVRGGFDLAHAFSGVDAAAALGWRRLTRRPVVFTLVEPVARETLSDRRLRAQLLRQAVERSDAVTVPTDAGGSAAWRWLAVDVAVLDEAAHERLYRSLANRRAV